MDQDIKTGWLIDGTGNPAVAGAVLGIRNGRIESIQTESDYGGTSAEDHTRRVTDLSAYTILPGLIDAHVHLSMSGTTDAAKREKQLRAGYDNIEAAIAGHLENHIRCGIIAVRDGGDHGGHVGRYKQTSQIKNPVPVIIKTAGKAWYKKGRYGRLTGTPVLEGLSLAGSIDNILGDPHKAYHIDHVKVINSGLNSLSDFGKQTPPQFEADELEAAVNLCSMRGLKIMAHANGELPVNVSIDSGCHSIEHGFFMGAANLEKMSEKRIVWVPTAFTMKAYAALSDLATPRRDVALRNLDYQMEQISVARNFGVKIGLGTDSGSPGVHHGASLCEELKILMDSGYSPEEGIQCATSVNAELLGLNDLGRLTHGRRANFIVIKGHPSDLPGNLESITSVYIDGKEVDHSKLSG